LAEHSQDEEKTGRKQLNHFLYMTVLDGETLSLGDIVFSIKQTGPTQSKSYQGENHAVFILELFSEVSVFTTVAVIL
jgi:hypothetical protein